MTVEEVHAAALKALEFARDLAGLAGKVTTGAYLWPPGEPNRLGLSASWRFFGGEPESLSVELALEQIEFHASGATCAMAMHVGVFMDHVRQRLSQA